MLIKVDSETMGIAEGRCSSKDGIMVAKSFEDKQ